MRETLEGGSEWDQPPLEMRPQGSITIKDYAIETPLKRLSTALEGESCYDVEIDININSQIATINFVLKDEETGAWYQHRGMDFKVPLMDYAHDDSNMVGGKKGFGIWTCSLDSMFIVLYTGRLGSCVTCSLNLKSIILKVKMEAMAQVNLGKKLGALQDSMKSMLLSKRLLLIIQLLSQ
nr:alpha-amylase 3, chloroplastic isoform X2 [Ipomoea batatas]